ncbi:MAG TPA: hypothetical protein VJJ24_02205 [Candidatus Paceibacterota bacterium]
MVPRLGNSQQKTRKKHACLTINDGLKAKEDPVGHLLLYWLWCFTHVVGYFRGDYNEWRDAPEPKNLCQYLWRIILLTFPIGIVALVIGLLVLALIVVDYVVWGVGTILMVGVGAARPTSHPFKDMDARTSRFWDPEPFEPVMVRDFDIPKWVIVVSLEIIGLLSLVFWFFPSFRHFCGAMLFYFGTGLIAVALVAGLCWLAIALKRGLASKVRHSDAWPLFREGYRAWKDKHCPRVVVVRPVA